MKPAVVPKGRSVAWILLLLLLFPAANATKIVAPITRGLQPACDPFIKLGTDIEGTFESANGRSSIALNSNGTTLAAGVKETGSTALYRYVECIGCDRPFHWTSLPRIETGRAGYVALDASGDIVASGLPGSPFATKITPGYVRVDRFYVEEISNAVWGRWEQIGGNITSDVADATDFFGGSIDLSADGMTVAIGAPRRGDMWQDGRAYVYRYNGQDWNLLGEFQKSTEGEQYGQSVALSSDGNTVAIGARGLNEGYVEVFRYDDAAAGGWDQLGDTLVGSSVSLSENGLILAIRIFPTFTNLPGEERVFPYARVFNYMEGSGWAQLGGDVGNPTSGALSLSGDGSLIVLGKPSETQVFHFQSGANSWLRLGNDTSANLLGGSDVAFSTDGTVFATGGEGHIRLHEIDPECLVVDGAVAPTPFPLLSPSLEPTISASPNTNIPPTQSPTLPPLEPTLAPMEVTDTEQASPTTATPIQSPTLPPLDPALAPVEAADTGPLSSDLSSSSSPCHNGHNFHTMSWMILPELLTSLLLFIW